VYGSLGLLIATGHLTCQEIAVGDSEF